MRVVHIKVVVRCVSKPRALSSLACDLKGALRFSWKIKYEEKYEGIKNKHVRPTLAVQKKRKKTFKKKKKTLESRHRYFAFFGGIFLRNRAWFFVVLCFRYATCCAAFARKR